MKKRYAVTLSSPSMKRIIAVMEAATEPLDGRQITDRAHVSLNTFRNGYRLILEEAGVLHLAGYKNNHHGPFIPLYFKGPNPNADEPLKPEKLDQLKRSRNWKERSGYYEAMKAQRRLQRPPDAALAALMGLPR